MSDYHVRQDCRLCSGTYTEVLDLGETALANEVWEDPSKSQDTFPLKLVQCDSCGHMQNPVVVNPERLFRSYPYTSSLTETYRKHLHEYAKQVANYTGDDGLVVEIGGNDGELGAHLATNYINVDPSDVAQPFGLRIPEFFTAEVAKRTRSDFGPAKVIVANHVFAHADDLHDMAEGVRELLADDGVFFCEVGHGPTQFKGGLSVVYHEHFSYHDATSLSKFLKVHGLKLRKISYNDAQGGSMRLECIRKERPMPLPETRYDIRVSQAFDLPTIRAQAANMRGLGKVLDRLDSIDEPYGNPGYNQVAVYGCPAKLTTLLALTGFRPWMVFDDSPRKIGKRVPGHPNAVISEPTLEAMNRYDFMLIASWNFEKEIRERWSGYTGTWIVPEPTVRFVPGGQAT